MRCVPVLAVLLAVPAAAQSAPGARAFALGGAGVAVAEPWTAPFANPALVRFRDERVPRGTVLPWVSAAAGDPNGLEERIDDFQDVLDELQARIDASDPTADALRPIVIDALAGLDGRTVVADADVGTTVLVPLRDFTLAFSARERATLRAFPSIDEADFDTIADPLTTSLDLDALLSAGVVYGAETSEFGVTFAYEGVLAGRRLSIGLTPKFASIDVTNYAQGVGDFDQDGVLDDLRAGERQVRRDTFNVDVGLALELDEGVLFGATVRDALRHDIVGSDFDRAPFTYRVRPHPTLGLAIQQGAFTFTAEADAWPARPFSDAGETQFVRMGGEGLVGAGFALRAGFAHDLRDTYPDVFTCGIGAPTGLGVGWDLGAQVGDDALGAALQVSFAF